MRILTLGLVVIAAAGARGESGARVRENFNQGWLFARQSNGSGALGSFDRDTSEAARIEPRFQNAPQAAYDDASWQPVNLPHTWNAHDVMDEVMADQIDVADIDTEFQRRGRDQHFQLAEFEPLLGIEPLSLAMLPWCAVTSSSPRRSDNCRATRSAIRRVLTKTRVVRWDSDQLGKPVVDLVQTSADMTASSGEEGTSNARSRARYGRYRQSRRMRCLRSRPDQKPRDALIGFCVAERPIRYSGSPHSACSRSSDNARCAPRLFGASAWISSTITLRSVASIARPDSEPSRMLSNSGVVTTICGGRRRIRVTFGRCVSPVRTQVRISTSRSPRALEVPALMPASGNSRFRWMSFDSALSGDT